MLAYARSLLAGPAWRPAGHAGIGRISAVAPLVLFAVLMAGSGVAGLAGPRAGDLIRGVALAAAATLACLVLAIQAALAGPGWPWLVPVWLGAGLAGWSLLPMPATWVTEVVAVAATLLPIAVVCLAAGGPGLSWADRRVAAACGADGPAVLRHLFPAIAWPALRRTAALVFVLAIGLLLRAG